MCETINSNGNWIGANAIAVVALAVAILQGWLMIWQVKKAQREQEKNALAEQRYAIFENVDSLLISYINLIRFNHGNTTPDPTFRREILRLLASPTTMKSEEIKFILGAISDSANLSFVEGEKLIRALHTDLINKLNPDLMKAFSDLGRARV